MVTLPDRVPFTPRTQSTRVYCRHQSKTVIKATVYSDICPLIAVYHWSSEDSIPNDVAPKKANTSWSITKATVAYIASFYDDASSVTRSIYYTCTVASYWSQRVLSLLLRAREEHSSLFSACHISRDKRTSDLFVMIDWPHLHLRCKFRVRTSNVVAFEKGQWNYGIESELHPDYLMNDAQLVYKESEKRCLFASQAVFRLWRGSWKYNDVMCTLGFTFW